MYDFSQCFRRSAVPNRLRKPNFEVTGKSIGNAITTTPTNKAIVDAPERCETQRFHHISPPEGKSERAAIRLHHDTNNCARYEMGEQILRAIMNKQQTKALWPLAIHHRLCCHLRWRCPRRLH